MATTYTLFPPVIDTYAPAFILEDDNGESKWKGSQVDIKFYFKISQFNTKEDIGTSHSNNYNIIYNAVEVVLKDVQTNEYCFNTRLLDDEPLNTIVLDAEWDKELQSYYIRLPINRNFFSSKLGGTSGERFFNINSYKYYQLQLRFISSSIEGKGTQFKNNFLELFSEEYSSTDARIMKPIGVENEYLSEWSSVCLIRPIEKPEITLTIPSKTMKFDSYGNIIADNDDIVIGENRETTPYKIDDPELTICGKIIFPNGEDAKVKEYLKTYQLKFYLNNGTLMHDSGIIEILNNSNEFVYPIEYLLLDGSQYYIELYFTTNNLYSFNTKKIYFLAQLDNTIQEGFLNFRFPDGYVTEQKGDDIIRWDVNSQDGQNIIQNASNNGEIIEIKKFYPVKMGVNNTGEIDILIYWNQSVNPKPARLTIYRSDLRSGFLKWEKILENEIPLGLIGSRYAFNDTTAEDGIWYKYAARIRTGENYEQHSATIYAYNLTKSYVQGLTDKAIPPVMSNLDNMYLISEDKYLMIKLNPIVNSYKVKTIDSITETLGSKYPFVRRNGVVKYRQLQIGGLISRHMDENQRFADEYDLYNKYYYLYDRYNNEYNIGEYNDYIYERVFRERVIEFLNNGKPKLLRSPTEGVLLVKLTDITLTPNQQLGRMIYSFSATATEIDECSIDNFIKYDILNLQKALGYFFTPVIKDSGTKNSFQEINYADNDIILSNGLELYGNNIICPKTFPETNSAETGSKDAMEVVEKDPSGDNFSTLKVFEENMYHSSLESIDPYEVFYTV